MDDLLSTLHERAVVGDGSIGATLFSRLGKKHATSEEFNLHEPDGVIALHRDYVDAGAELITTNTFSANRISFARQGLLDRLVEINHRAVEHALAAADGRAWVVGSVGPTGELLEPYGDLTEARAREAFEEQIKALVEAGVDLIAIETMSSLEEAHIAFLCARSVTDRPVAVSFTIDQNLRTMMGTTVEQFAHAALDWGADIIGTNCGVGPKEVEIALQKMRDEVPAALLWGEPNAGLPRMEGTTVVYDMGPEDLANYAEVALARGARVVGSCCGSTPEHTRAIASRIRPLQAGDLAAPSQ